MCVWGLARSLVESDVSIRKNKASILRLAGRTFVRQWNIFCEMYRKCILRETMVDVCWYVDSDTDCHWMCGDSLIVTVLCSWRKLSILKCTVILEPDFVTSCCNMQMGTNGSEEDAQFGNKVILLPSAV